MSFLPFMRVTAGVAAALVFIGCNFTASAETAETSALAADASAMGADSSTLPPILVTAQNLDERRSCIQTQTGATTYTIDAAAIAATPGGDNTLLNQVILQTPDVAQDSFGQFHVRGEHNGLQYRINGIILPEGISVFGQSLDPRLDFLVEPDRRAHCRQNTGCAPPASSTSRPRAALLAPGGRCRMYGGSHGDGRAELRLWRRFRAHSATSSPAISCAMTSASSRPTAARTRSTTTRRSITASAISKTSSTTQNRVALMLGSSVGQVSDSEPRRAASLVRLTVDGSLPAIFRARTSTKISAKSPQFGALELAAFGGRVRRANLRSSPATRA